MKQANVEVTPTRYWELTERLRDQIRSGEYSVGDKLPTETELCASFQVSRHTLREALKVLTEEGLISRRPRAGSTVIATHSATQFTQAIGSIGELMNYSADSIRQLLSASYVEADHELAALLKCLPGTSWFRIRSLRFYKGSSIPLCHTDIFLLPELAAVVKHKKHALIPIADQIEEMFGKVAHLMQVEISAAQIPIELAGALQAPEGSPALTLIRRYSDIDGKIFEVAVAIHPAQRYTYSFHLKRQSVVKSSALKRRRSGQSAALK
jgi:GntR family transcriptional regulator